MNDVMNPEIKAQWLAALRSGEYTQTNGALRREDSDGSVGFCCLGVLCDVLAKDGKVKYEPEAGYPDLRNYGAGVDSEGDFVSGSAFSLPYVVCELVGISTDAGEFEDAEGHNRSLISLNDSQGKTFPEIADFIEKYF
jgi:hypothetical protein